MDISHIIQILSFVISTVVRTTTPGLNTIVNLTLTFIQMEVEGSRADKTKTARLTANTQNNCLGPQNLKCLKIPRFIAYQLL